MASSVIRNVAIVGAGGNSGSFMARELIRTGKHKVTAITRISSQTKLPEGLAVKTVDYNDARTLVEALRGQDALTITLSPMASAEQRKLIEAAVEAGVQYVMPNHWAPDTADEGLAKDVAIFGRLAQFAAWVESLGKIKLISLATGFWYEWSLAIPDAFGLDFVHRRMTFFDDGATPISTSTWPQVGRAVAATWSLPRADLDKLAGKLSYVNSFTLSQQEMFESALRVTKTSKEDWTIEHVPAEERWRTGIEAMQKGDRAGFARQMYSRVFYKDGNGDFASSRGTLNEKLGLPAEDLDEATAIAEERSKTPFY